MFVPIRLLSLKARFAQGERREQEISHPSKREDFIYTVRGERSIAKSNPYERTQNSLLRNILIANRGEVALRIQSSCRACGMQTIAIYAPEDVGLAFVAGADNAFQLAGSGYAAYIAQDDIIDCALKAKADAIHPGYGFLSENAEFAQKVVAAGLVWIGPSPESIRLMGNKQQARTIAIAAGIPVIPGHACSTESLDAYEQATAHALAIGYPVIIKDPCAGGGKAMRIARTAADFMSAWERVVSEAAVLTGSRQLVIEKYIECGRHIEVQIAGDGENFIHLFERDCSVQRRNQKVIEEAPARREAFVPVRLHSPGALFAQGEREDSACTVHDEPLNGDLEQASHPRPSTLLRTGFCGDQGTSHVVALAKTDKTSISNYEEQDESLDPGSVSGMTKKEALFTTALALARAAHYDSIGTVEFLVAPDGSFYFLEMNTRLQVEHSVTECITGVDLVALQLHIARHKALPLTQADIHCRGHAIECRIYAEDPANKFMPSTGTITHLTFPSTPFVRIDHDLAAGQTIGAAFDPMIAKITTWGQDRRQATLRMLEALANVVLDGVTTNLALLKRVLQSEDFVNNAMHTQSLADPTYQGKVLATEITSNDTIIMAAVIAHLLSERQTHVSPQRGHHAPSQTNDWKRRQWK